jgi:hypothetical protein
MTMTAFSAPLAAVMPPVPSATPTAGGGAAPTSVGYGVSLTDLSAFNQSLAGASGRLEARATSATGPAMKAIFQPLEQINQEAVQLSQHAKAAMQSGTDLTPGEMVMLTVKCQEFMFHSQLTANIANRTSDGLQQLFRQQT